MTGCTPNKVRDKLAFALLNSHRNSFWVGVHALAAPSVPHASLTHAHHRHTPKMSPTAVFHALVGGCAQASAAGYALTAGEAVKSRRRQSLLSSALVSFSTCTHHHGIPLTH
jgi:hypothetical protein